MFSIILTCSLLIPTIETQSQQELVPEQYTIVIMTAGWCTYCQKLKKSFGAKLIKDLVKSQYKNDLHWINVDDPKNKLFIKEYQKDPFALPTIFILQRTGPTQGKILTSKVGYMPSILLINFLRNPAKYKSQ